MDSPLLCILLLTISSTTTASLIVDINEDFYQTSKVNPCDLMALDNPSGYCDCNNDLSEVEIVSCGFYKNPSETEWQATSLFRTVTIIQFISRPLGAIKEVPPPYVFTGMRKLNFFTMKNSMLSTVRGFAFGNSSSIAGIDLKDNVIIRLSENAFADLTNLTDINLSENNLTEINRQVFVNLPKLRELVLSKNGIEVVHDNAFKGLKNLQELALQNNRLSVISREVFTGLQKLKHLELQENRIEYIGDHTFAELSNLYDLDLHQNQIISISPLAFAGLKQLARLNLKDNKIVKLLPPDTFRFFEKIHFLDLRNNELESLRFPLMKPIYKNLKNMNMQLLVKGNRFSCDCQTLWMKTLYEETESGYVRSHLSGVTCNLFDRSKTKLSQPSTFFHSDGGSSDITLLNSPPEETTPSSFDRVMSILNLTETDFNCADHLAEDDMKNPDLVKPSHDTTYSYHHLTDENEKERIAAAANHRGFQPSEFSSEDISLDSSHNSILNEPQATAALEGSSGNSSPQGTTSVHHHKTDTSKIRQDSPSSSPKFIVCDFTTLLIASFVVTFLSSFKVSF